jgi:hypothetical protein
MAELPAPRAALLAMIAALAAEEAAAADAHERVQLRLRAAVLRNSGYVLREDHPDHLSLTELGAALGRHWSRPAAWCHALLEDRDGVRTRTAALLGHDPVPDYGPDHPPGRPRPPALQAPAKGARP